MWELKKPNRRQCSGKALLVDEYAWKPCESFTSQDFNFKFVNLLIFNFKPSKYLVFKCASHFTLAPYIWNQHPPKKWWKTAWKKQFYFQHIRISSAFSVYLYVTSFGLFFSFIWTHLIFKWTMISLQLSVLSTCLKFKKIYKPSFVCSTFCWLLKTFTATREI